MGSNVPFRYRGHSHSFLRAEHSAQGGSFPPDLACEFKQVVLQMTFSSLRELRRYCIKHRHVLDGHVASAPLIGTTTSLGPCSLTLAMSLPPEDLHGCVIGEFLM